MFRNRERSLWRITLTVIAVAIALFFFRRPGDMGIPDTDQALLLDWARQQLIAVAGGDEPITVPFAEITNGLQNEGSAFVSLYEGAQLRGCMIDEFVPHEPLYRNVLRNTVLAAGGDERFPAVTPGEVGELRIVISIIALPEVVAFDDPAELLDELVPGIDGVILTVNESTSAYLPSVWDTFPDPEAFLSQLCLKQGLPEDRWRQQPFPRIETFRVFDFAEDS